jgi:hypothetical protein
MCQNSYCAQAVQRNLPVCKNQQTDARRGKKVPFLNTRACCAKRKLFTPSLIVLLVAQFGSDYNSGASLLNKEWHLDCGFSLAI